MLEPTTTLPTEPEPELPQFQGKTRAQLIRWIQSLTVESTRNRAGRKYWKAYAKRLESELAHHRENR